MILGALFMYLWKKRDFCLYEVWQRKRTMSLGNFATLLCVFVGCQAAFQMIGSLIEMILNIFGLSAMASLESATGVQTSFSMFLYAAVLAPIGEEILFRGLLLRSFLPFGKKFAILASAILFGVFHGNVVQSPYAFLVGLVLGYTAVEYSIRWAIILHMINNLLLSQVMGMLSSMLPGMFGELITVGLIWGCALTAIVILILRRREVVAFRAEGKIHPWPLKAFFTAPGVIIFFAVMLLNAISLLVMAPIQ